MPSVPMPRDLSEEAVAEWLYGLAPTCARVPVSNDPAMTWAECVEECPGLIEHFRVKARAVRALLREKVREAVDATKDATDPYCECDNSGTGGPIHLRFDATDAIVARVMGTDEGRPAREEAPRG